VGRDVDSIIRDLAETAFTLEHDERLGEVREQAERVATERIINYLIDQRADLRSGKRKVVPARMQAQAAGGDGTAGTTSPTVVAESVQKAAPEARPALSARALKQQRTKMARLLAEHKLDEEQIEIDLGGMDSIADDLGGVMEFEPGMSLEEMSDQFNEFLDGYRSVQNDVRRFKRMKRVSVREARRILTDEEAHKLIDVDTIIDNAVRRTEQTGVVFIDEIDKITGHAVDTGPDVSGVGVQRDLLPIVEGSTVHTRYGSVKTDHILFIAAGAFHSSKPADLIPELQGRFPLRVELESLGTKELASILSEPENSLVKQYTAMLETEGVKLEIEPSGMERIAAIATELNERMEDIGARRLHTIMEQVLEDLSFRAEEESGNTITVDAAYVDERVKSTANNDDLSRYIL
jgi:ATP-dependent HslUV protease ATP-binding subunit HslU